ncbi:MAG: helix-turn-helix transcriptional regulator [Acidobacteriia bacterium]|nr:helix-turn-helix transcriptional regulator [Terriglobia bacterium]
MSPDSLNRNLATNIRRHRQAQGWSQEELAERCGVHRTYIGSVERGERNVTLQTLEKIARALEVDAISLLRPLRR